MRVKQPRISRQGRARSVQCLVTRGSIAAGSTPTGLGVVAVNRIGLTGRAHFMESLKQSLAVFGRVPDGPCAVRVLNNPVRRCHSAAVFHKYTVRRDLSGVAGMGPGGRTGVRLDLNRDQLIRSVHEVIRFPAQAIPVGYQWTLDVATTVRVLVDDAALQNPTF